MHAGIDNRTHIKSILIYKFSSLLCYILNSEGHHLILSGNQHPNTTHKMNCISKQPRASIK